MIAPGEDVEFSHEKETSVSIQCNMDIYYFPFDKHTCQFSLQLIGYLLPDGKWNRVIVHKKKGLELALFSDLVFEGSVDDTKETVRNARNY